MTSKLPHYLSSSEYEEKQQKRRTKAASLGLPEDASPTDIYFAEKRIATEKERKQLAKAFGLPEETGWDEIRRKENEEEALHYGLPRNADYNEVREARKSAESRHRL